MPTFTMSMGDRGPVYQRTDKANKNVSFSLSLDNFVPAEQEGEFVLTADLGEL